MRRIRRVDLHLLAGGTLRAIVRPGDNAMSALQWPALGAATGNSTSTSNGNVGIIQAALGCSARRWFLPRYPRPPCGKLWQRRIVQCAISAATATRFPLLWEAKEDVDRTMRSFDELPSLATRKPCGSAWPCGRRTNSAADRDLNLQGLRAREKVRNCASVKRLVLHRRCHPDRHSSRLCQQAAASSLPTGACWLIRPQATSSPGSPPFRRLGGPTVPQSRSYSGDSYPRRVLQRIPMTQSLARV
jgi:hypothetical protein